MKRYFIRIDDRQAGPFTKDQLRSRRITPGTEVWNEVAYDWTLASSLEELRDLLSDEPAPLDQPKPRFWSRWCMNG